MTETQTLVLGSRSGPVRGQRPRARAEDEYRRQHRDDTHPHRAPDLLHHPGVVAVRLVDEIAGDLFTSNGFWFAETGISGTTS